MTTFSVDLLELLGDRYDIELEEYWSLSDEEKDNLSNIVIQSIFTTLKREPATFPLYVRLIQDRVKIAEYHDQFEEAEIFNRIQKELLKISPLY